MKLTHEELLQIIKEELDTVLQERCQKGYKTHPTRKTKEMFGRTYRNCVKAEEGLELEEKKDCFDNKTFDGKVKCIQRTKGLSKERASAYVASVLRDMGEIDEAKAYHWDEPDWFYGGGYGDGPLEEKKKKKSKKKGKKRKKAGSESSKETSLHHWFKRKGAKGKKKGWVDCNAPDGKGGYKSCGRSSGEKRKKYPACRPTPGACK